MFARSFVGACIAGVALSLKFNEVDQTSAAITEILSQTEAGAISAAICLRAPTRNKDAAAVPDFYGIYGGTSQFTDSTFSHDWTAVAWTDASETVSGFT